MAGNNGWIGVDLDGTLAHYETGDGVDSIGKPIPLMVKYVKENYLDHGTTVKIMTARVGGDDEAEIMAQMKMISDWTLEVFGVRLEVTATKDFKMIRLYDDRARQVITNRGIVV